MLTGEDNPKRRQKKYPKLAEGPTVRYKWATFTHNSRSIHSAILQMTPDTLFQLHSENQQLCHFLAEAVKMWEQEKSPSVVTSGKLVPFISLHRNEHFELEELPPIPTFLGHGCRFLLFPLYFTRNSNWEQLLISKDVLTRAPSRSTKQNKNMNAYEPKTHPYKQWGDDSEVKSNINKSPVGESTCQLWIVAVCG